MASRLRAAAGLLLAVLCLVTRPAGADEADNRLSRFLDGLETYSAAFKQVQYNETGEELEQAVGVVYLRKPGMFHWAYWEPYAQTIISDGITLWIYEQDLEQVIVKNAVDSIGDSPAALLGGDVKLDDYYIVLDLGTQDDIDWLELTSRDVDSQYNSVRLGFTGEQLVRMELFDSLGYRTVISFLDTRRNAPLNRDLFHFTPPPGTDVIDTREPQGDSGASE